MSARGCRSMALSALATLTLLAFGICGYCR